MAMDAPAAAPTRPLPPTGDYLRAVFELGRRSIPAALPALVFLWFYRFGTGLYLEMAAQGTSPLGFRDDRAYLTQVLMSISAYLPLLALVYTPFLPLQDSLLRGERRSFVSSIRHVLERMASFIGSIILQGAILFGPAVIVGAILLALIAPLRGLPREILPVVLVTVFIPMFLWLLLAGYFLLFAIPGVVLSDLGPRRSIAASVRLVATHFWGLLARFLAFFVIVWVVVAAASLPALVLGVGTAAVSRAGPAFRIGILLWSGLLAALTFPFWVASLLVLYRALVPSVTPAPDAAARDAVAGEEALGLPTPGEIPPEGERPAPLPFE